MMRRLRHTISRLSCALLLVGAAQATSHAQDLSSFEKRTTVKVLPNGLTLIVIERPVAPVFSYMTHVDVGGSDEPIGQTGIAHMFEHMAFKGTDRIGTKNYALEKTQLDAVEKAYAAYDRERRKPVGRDEKKLAELEKAWKTAIDTADKTVQPNEFAEIIDRAGGVGLNAFTNSDETGYFFSFPSNRFELWAYLESERAKRPVMRQFYQERDVVNEERRMRTDSNPTGRLFEQAFAAAFTAHPYGRPVVGWASDLSTWSATDALKFWEKYYVASNMAVAVAGDVKAAEVLPVMEAYFGRLPKLPKPAPLTTIEPEQNSERMVILRDASQPVYFEAYHRPNTKHPDDAVYDAIADLLSTGRTSRLYRALVRDQKIAARAAGFVGQPGTKYPHLFSLFALPTPGHTPQEMRSAIHKELDRLKTEPVNAEELKMVKTRAKVNLLRSLANNQGLALAFATSQQRDGDWREVFRNVDRIEKVTPQDIQRVASGLFVDKNRTAAWIERVEKTGGKSPASASPAGAGNGGK